MTPAQLRSYPAKPTIPARPSSAPWRHTGVQAAGAIVTDYDYAAIVAAFADEDAAYSAYGRLQDAEASGGLGIEGVLVIKTDDQGMVKIQKMTDHSTKTGVKWGAVGGVLLGIFFPPTIIAAAVGTAAVGGVLGKIRNEWHKSEVGDALYGTLGPDESGILALVNAGDVAAVTAEMPAANRSAAPVWTRNRPVHQGRGGQGLRLAPRLREPARARAGPRVVPSRARYIPGPLPQLPAEDSVWAARPRHDAPSGYHQRAPTRDPGFSGLTPRRTLMSDRTNDDHRHTRLSRALPLDRFNGLSDGVFAIAITLLVLELPVPEGPDLVSSLLEEWPEFLGYLISFAFIGASWMTHALTTKYMKTGDTVAAGLNLLALLFITLIPFATNLMVSNIGGESERVAVVIYGLVVLVGSLSLTLLMFYLVRQAGRCLQGELG